MKTYIFKSIQGEVEIIVKADYTFYTFDAWGVLSERIDELAAQEIYVPETSQFRLDSVF